MRIWIKPIHASVPISESQKAKKKNRQPESQIARTSYIQIARFVWLRKKPESQKANYMKLSSILSNFILPLPP